MKYMNNIVIIVVLLLSLLYYSLNLFDNNVVYVVSQFDNVKYLVRNDNDKQKASNMIGQIRAKLKLLVEHCSNNSEKYKNYEKYINRLKNKYDNIIFCENGKNSTYTSYSINKGEKIVLCLRSRKNDSKDKLHDPNLVMYVAIHELSHVACPEHGHTDLFKYIFAFLTEVSVKLQIYKLIDFENLPTEYCGLIISDSII